jgi:hypothetical protein
VYEVQYKTVFTAVTDTERNIASTSKGKQEGDEGSERCAKGVGGETRGKETIG